jgi:hypothetical protein
MLIKVGDLMRESWTLYKENFKLFAKILLWLLVPTVVLSMLPALPLNLAVFVPLNLFLSLVSFFLGLFIAIALIFVVNALIKKQTIDLTAVYNLSYSKMLSYLWISILTILAVLGGTILFIIPGIIFSVWFSFAAYILVIEGVSGTRALSASKELVKGYFWPVLWKWIAPYFIYFLIVLAIVFLPIYLIGLAIGSPWAGFSQISPWWSALISNVISTFTVPLFTATGVLIYNSLKKEKESKPTA